MLRLGLALLLLVKLTQASALLVSDEPAPRVVWASSLLQDRQRLRPGLGQVTDLEAARDAASERELLQSNGERLSVPKAWPKLEMLRFVTPYGAELDAITDATHYSHLLESALETGSLGFYVSIDTWVSNNTERKIMYVNNVTGQCTPVKTSAGNGWNVSVDLLIWPQADRSVGSMSGEALRPTVKPKATIALAAGYDATLVDFGVITALEGTLQGRSEVVLHDAFDLADVPGEALIYECPGGIKEFKKEALMGFISRQGELLLNGASTLDGAKLQEQKLELEKDMLEFTIANDMVAGTITSVTSQTASEKVLLDVTLSSNASLVRGMPVFYAESSAVTDEYMDSADRWWNESLPFEPMGFIQHILNRTTFVMNVSDNKCFAKANPTKLPGVRVPNNSHVFPDGIAKVQAAIHRGMTLGSVALEMDAAGSDRGKLEDDRLVFLKATATGQGSLVDFLQREPIASVETGTGRNATSLLGATPGAGRGIGSKVCVVQQKLQGRILTRRFSASLDEGDHTLLQITVTGHGWSATSEQCGEYCHAVFHLKLNGRSLANVTQWRDDCKLNPTGQKQRGTWWESRNGWCPGSVEPGLFIDATSGLGNSANEEHLLTVDVTVWSNLTHRYSEYSDFSGFAMGDKAFFALALNLLVYDSNAAAVAQSMEQPRTKAEAALKQGSSDPSALKPPAMVRSDESPQSLAQKAERSKRLQRRESSASQLELGSYNFEGRSPWYFYNETADGVPGASSGGVAIPLFTGQLMQSNTRTIEKLFPRQHLELPSVGRASKWQQIALRLRLGKPAGKLETDHWDRLGAVGLMLPSASGVQVRTADRQPTTFKTWNVKPL